MYEYMKLSKISLSALLTFSLYWLSSPSSAMISDEDEEYIMPSRFAGSLSLDDSSTSTETRRHYDRLSHLLPKTHIPQKFQSNKDFDQFFSGIRVSRVGSVIRIGNREYNVSNSAELITIGYNQVNTITNLPEVVNSCLNAEEVISYYLPVTSFIDSKVNFLNGKKSGAFFPPIETTVGGVHIYSTPGQITIGSHVYALSEGKIILEYKNRNPTGMLIDQPAVPFIEAIITEVRSHRRENEQKTRDIERYQERKAASIERHERQKVAKQKKQQEKQKKSEESIKESAKNLGISDFNVQHLSPDELKRIVKQKKQENKKKQDELNRQAYLMREARRQGRSSDFKEPYKRKTEYGEDGRIVSDDNGREVGDGRGGKFWAVWGKDDN